MKQVGSQEPWEADRGWVLRVSCTDRHLDRKVPKVHPSRLLSFKHLRAKMRDRGEPQGVRLISELLGEDTPQQSSLRILIIWTFRILAESTVYPGL